MRVGNLGQLSPHRVDGLWEPIPVASAISPWVIVPGASVASRPVYRLEYPGVLGESLTRKYGDWVDQIVPLSATFLGAISFEEWVRIKNRPLDELINLLSEETTPL